MPFYNPGDALAPTVRRAHESLTEAGVGFEIIAVSDGSTDGSEKTLEGMPPEVKVVILPANRGKGGALHAGFARASGSWLGFVDSDGDIDPAHLVDYVRVARRGGYDIVFANKKHDHVGVGLLSLPQARLVRLLVDRRHPVLPRGQRHADRLQGRPPRRHGRPAPAAARDPLRLRPRALRRRRDRRLPRPARRAGAARGAHVRIHGHQEDHPPHPHATPCRSWPAATTPTPTGLSPLGAPGSTARRLTSASPPDPPTHRPTTPTKENPMRILILTWRDLAHSEAGGAEVYTEQVTRRWAAAGHDVTLFAATVARPAERRDRRRLPRRPPRRSPHRLPRGPPLVPRERPRPVRRRHRHGQHRALQGAPVDQGHPRDRLLPPDRRGVLALQRAAARRAAGRYLFEPQLDPRLPRPPGHGRLAVHRRRARPLRRARHRHPARGLRAGRRAGRAPRRSAPPSCGCARLVPYKRPQDVVEAARIAREQIPDLQVWIMGGGPMLEELRDDGARWRRDPRPRRARRRRSSAWPVPTCTSPRAPARAGGWW